MKRNTLPLFLSPLPTYSLVFHKQFLYQTKQEIKQITKNESKFRWQIIHSNLLPSITTFVSQALEQFHNFAPLEFAQKKG